MDERDEERETKLANNCK